MGSLRYRIIDTVYKIAYRIKPRFASDIMYFCAFHKWQDLKNPKSLIEKINWLQFNSDTSMWSLCADKYRMREYVEKCGLSDYLPKLYGHWDNPDEIDFDSLPDEFVLKSNNGCGTVKIVRDKSTLDIAATKKMLRGWLKPYGYVGGQTHYMRITPCIIAEELLHQEDEQNLFSPVSMVDYKVWCFHGVPECILVVFDRVGKKYLMDMYDVHWNRIPNSLKQNSHYGVTSDKISKPVCLNQMLDLAAKLSKPFAEVRADFYVIGDKPVIGELTFTSGYGNYTDDYYLKLGKKIDLSRVKKKH